MDRKGTVVSPNAAAAVLELRTVRAVRSRCDAMLAAANVEQLEHMTVRLEMLPDAVKRVAEALGPISPDRPPPLAGRWRDFAAGGRDRWRELGGSVAGATPDELAKARFDLAVVASLLDADAGDAWTYREAETGSVLGRHEGVAVATFRAFQKGMFSSRAGDPLRADAAGLSKITAEGLEAAFPGAAEHALHQLERRAELLRDVGGALLQSPHLFGQGEGARFGGLFDVCARRAARATLAARDVFGALAEGLGPALDGPVALGGVHLGDVWPHVSGGGDGPGVGLVPIHRTLQLATYSLIEPLEEAGHTVADVHELTGLPEAWTGGLFVDTEVVVPKLEGTAAVVHAASAPLVIEWRALTVSLIDRLAEALRAELGVTETALPVGRLLPAIRAAGQAAAQERRGSDVPPIRVDGDGLLV